MAQEGIEDFAATIDEAPPEGDLASFAAELEAAPVEFSLGERAGNLGAAFAKQGIGMLGSVADTVEIAREKMGMDPNFLPPGFSISEDGKIWQAEDSPDRPLPSENVQAVVDAIPGSQELLQDEFSTKLAGALGSGAAFIAGGAQMQALKGIARFAGMAGLGFAASASQGYNEILEATGDEEKAMKAYFAHGTLGMADMLPIELLFIRLNTRSGGLFGSMLTDAMKQAGAEGSEEFIQQIGGNAVWNLLTDEERDTYAGGLEAFMLGVASGGIMGGGARGLQEAARGAAGERSELEPLAVASDQADSSPPQSPEKSAQDGINPAPKSSEAAEIGAGINAARIIPAASALTAEQRVESARQFAAAQSLSEEASDRLASSAREAQSDAERAAQTLLEARGAQAVFVESDGTNPRSAVYLPGVAVIDVAGKDANAIKATAVHELTHHMAASMGNVESLAGALAAVDQAGFSDFRMALEARNLELDAAELTPEQAREESSAMMLASVSNYLMREMSEPGALGAKLAQSRTLLERFMDGLAAVAKVVGIKIKTTDQKRLDAIRAEVSKSAAEAAIDPKLAIEVATIGARFFEQAPTEGKAAKEIGESSEQAPGLASEVSSKGRPAPDTEADTDPQPSTQERPPASKTKLTTKKRITAEDIEREADRIRAEESAKDEPESGADVPFATDVPNARKDYTKDEAQPKTPIGKLAKAGKSGARKWLSEIGHMPQSAYNISADQAQGHASNLRETDHLAKDLEAAVLKDWKKKPHEVSEDEWAQIDIALKVDEAADWLLPPNISHEVGRMRQHVDGMSRQMIRDGVVQGDLAAHVEANMGVYLNRSYRIFDDPKGWLKNVPAEVFNRAVSFIGLEFKRAEVAIKKKIQRRLVYLAKIELALAEDTGPLEESDTDIASDIKRSALRAIAEAGSRQVALDQIQEQIVAQQERMDKLEASLQRTKKRKGKAEEIAAKEHAVTRKLQGVERLVGKVADAEKVGVQEQIKEAQAELAGVQLEDQLWRLHLLERSLGDAKLRRPTAEVVAHLDDQIRRKEKRIARLLKQAKAKPAKTSKAKAPKGTAFDASVAAEIETERLSTLRERLEVAKTAPKERAVEKKRGQVGNKWDQIKRARERIEKIRQRDPSAELTKLIDALEKKVESLTGASSAIIRARRRAPKEEMIARKRGQSSRKNKTIERLERRAEAVKYMDLAPSVESYRKGVEALRKRLERVSDIDAKAEVELILNKAAEKGDNPVAFMASGEIGSKNLSILKRRKLIAPEIRALYGEYRDPRVNYMRSVAKMSHLISMHRVLTEVREAGLREGYFVETKPKGDKTHPLASETSTTLAPLNDVFATKEVAEAFKHAFEPADPTAFIRLWLRLNGYTKAGKTIYSMQTHGKNILGNTFFALQQGHLSGKHLRLAAETTWQEFRTGKEKRDYILKLIKLGILGDSASGKEMEAVLEDAGLTMAKKTDNSFRRAVGGVLRVPQRAYELEDAVWKINAFEIEKARYTEGRPDMTAAQIEKKAAENVRNTYPTYSKINRLGHWLRRNVLFGNFIAFPMESVRVQYQTIRLIREELQYPGMRKTAHKRIAGVIGARAGVAAISSMSLYFAGMDSEDEEKARSMMAPWDAGGTFLWSKTGDQRKPSFLNISSLNPFSYTDDPIMSLFGVFGRDRGRGFGERALDSVLEFLEPFTSEEIFTKSAREAITNVDEWRREIRSETESVWDQGKDTAAFLWDDLQPGTVSTIERVNKALTGYVEDYGRAYSLKGELIASVAGLRSNVLDAEISIGFNGRRMSGVWSSSRNDISAAISTRGISADRLKAKYRNAEASRLEAWEHMLKGVQYMRGMGWTEDEINVLLDDKGGLTGPARRSLLSGVYEPYRPSNQIAESRAKDNEAGREDEIRANRRLLQDLADEARKATSDG